MTGKKYSYAAAQLANKCYDHLFLQMEEDASPFDPHIVEFVFNQLTINAVMKLWGQDTVQALEKEIKQLHWRKSFQPVHWRDLSLDQCSTVLEPHIFLQKKRKGKIRHEWWWVVIGNEATLIKKMLVLLQWQPNL